MGMELRVVRATRVLRLTCFELLQKIVREDDLRNDATGLKSYCHVFGDVKAASSPFSELPQLSKTGSLTESLDIFS